MRQAIVARPVGMPLQVILVAMLLLSAGCAPVLSAEEAPTPTAIPTPVVPQKPAYTVQRGEVVRLLSFSGRIEPVEQSQLFLRKSGRVRHVFVKQGDRVAAGQVLADLEMDDLERELASAQAELDSAQQKLGYDTRRAQTSLEIAKLAKEKMRWDGASGYDLALQDLRIQLAQIDLEELQTGLDPRLAQKVQNLKASVAEAQIISPMAGEVLSVSLSEGYPVDAYKPVMNVADTGNLEVSADLMSTQLVDLVKGMRVRVSTVNHPGQEIEGEIRQIPFPGGAGSDDADSSTRIRLAVPPAQAGYNLGDLVHVAVELEQKQDALWLPPQAVRIFEGRRFVVVQEKNAQARVDVKVGIQGEDRVEILEGVKEGQLVLAP